MPGGGFGETTRARAVPRRGMVKLSPPSVSLSLSRWLDDPARLAQMSARARALGAPRATLEIAAEIAEALLGLPAREPARARAPDAFA